MARSFVVSRSLLAALLGAFAVAACGGSTTSGVGQSSANTRDGGGSGGASASGGASSGGASSGGASTTFGAGSAGGGGASSGGTSTGSGGASTGGAGGSAGSGTGGMGSVDASAGGAASGDASIYEGGLFDGGTCLECMPAVDLHWGQDGGLVLYTETSRLGPCRSYSHERTPTTTKPPTLSCTLEFVGCPERTVSNIIRMLEAPEVKKALASHTVFGVDSRPVDGQVLRIGVGSDFFDVGSPCAGAPGCVAIPWRVRYLAELLGAVDYVALRTAPCSSTFGP
jgi:hypothetical protein